MDVWATQFNSDATAFQLLTDDCCGPTTEEGIEDQVSLISGCKNTSLYRGGWHLAWMTDTFLEGAADTTFDHEVLVVSEQVLVLCGVEDPYVVRCLTCGLSSLVVVLQLPGTRHTDRALVPGPVVLAHSGIVDGYP